MLGNVNMVENAVCEFCIRHYLLYERYPVNHENAPRTWLFRFLNDSGKIHEIEFDPKSAEYASYIDACKYIFDELNQAYGLNNESEPFTGEKNCFNCKHRVLDFTEEPCASCGIHKSYFEHRED